MKETLREQLNKALEDAIQTEYEAALKAELRKMIEHYEAHAAWERKRANPATKGSGIAISSWGGAKYNEGRAAACKEILELIG